MVWQRLLLLAPLKASLSALRSFIWSSVCSINTNFSFRFRAFSLIHFLILLYQLTCTHYITTSKYHLFHDIVFLHSFTGKICIHSMEKYFHNKKNRIIFLFLAYHHFFKLLPFTIIIYAPHALGQPRQSFYTNTAIYASNQFILLLLSNSFRNSFASPELHSFGLLLRRNLLLISDQSN